MKSNFTVYNLTSGLIISGGNWKTNDKELIEMFSRKKVYLFIRYLFYLIVFCSDLLFFTNRNNCISMIFKLNFFFQNKTGVCF